MTRRPKFLEGDKVRDKAELAGTVLETWGNGVKVRWDEMYSTWIDERFLHRANGEKALPAKEG